MRECYFPRLAGSPPPTSAAMTQNDAGHGRAASCDARRRQFARNARSCTPRAFRLAQGRQQSTAGAASIDLPAPGGPIIRMLWPPAAALPAPAWQSPVLYVLQVGHRLVAWVRRRQRALQRLQAFEVVDELKRLHGGGSHVGSGPGGLGAESRGQIRPLPSAFAPIAAGSAPAIAAIEPSRAARRARNRLRSRHGPRPRSRPTARARWEGRSGCLPSAGRLGRD